MVEHGVGKKHMGKKLVKLVIFCCCRLKERPESPIFTYVRVFRVFSFFFLVGRFAFEGRQSGLLGRGTVSDDGRRRRRRRSVRKADLGGAGAADGCAPPPPPSTTTKTSSWSSSWSSFRSTSICPTRPSSSVRAFHSALS